MLRRSSNMPGSRAPLRWGSSTMTRSAPRACTGCVWPRVTRVKISATRARRNIHMRLPLRLQQHDPSDELVTEPARVALMDRITVNAAR